MTVGEITALLVGQYGLVGRSVCSISDFVTLTLAAPVILRSLRLLLKVTPSVSGAFRSLLQRVSRSLHSEPAV